MLIRSLGALLLVGACAAAGISQQRELHRRVRRLRELRKQLGHMKTEVCRLMTPLPELLPQLTGCPLSAAELSRPFADVWDNGIAAMGLPREERALLSALGKELSAGEEPERVFAAAGEGLEELCRQAAEDAESRGRLCSAFGISTGLLLAIVLF